ncbi:hypothetical protein ANANG_G00092770 [Anguilla anguilla]|uniref:Uncharacterized protein n=1 Tax=Anguilla anguilla TaxID=7936 RepID=A0A9D3S142_ANGAN|nr:hypothetical protein ANANG_G00092770 [Anguilla anguilla]
MTVFFLAWWYKVRLARFFLLQQIQQMMTVAMMAMQTKVMMMILASRERPSPSPWLLSSRTGGVVAAGAAGVLFLGGGV